MLKSLPKIYSPTIVNPKLLELGPQEFIANNWNTDSTKIALQKPIYEGISQAEMATQIHGKKRSREKLPTWFSTRGTYYPKKLQLEQTSSEAAAAYKARIVSGKHLVDLTGGFGVDSYYFSKKMEQVVHCEIDTELSEIAQHNFKVLGIENCTTIAQDGLEYLQLHSQKVDWVYADPARRSTKKGKVFMLEDYTPDISKELGPIFEKTARMLLKTSPLLDITSGICQLRYVREVHVVAVKNEVKELLWVLEKGFSGAVTLKTTNLNKGAADYFDFELTSEQEVIAPLGEPSSYLYEPNAAILKSGGFKSVGKYFGVQKLHEHAHLYTSEKLVPFPGRRFQVKAVLPYRKKDMRQMQLTKANVTARNFPERVEAIRKKHRIKDGGIAYLFFTTNLKGQPIVLHCEKV